MVDNNTILNLNISYITAVLSLVGAIIGGIIVAVSNNMILRKSIKQQHETEIRDKRHSLYLQLIKTIEDIHYVFEPLEIQISYKNPINNHYAQLIKKHETANTNNSNTLQHDTASVYGELFATMVEKDNAQITQISSIFNNFKKAYIAEITLYASANVRSGFKFYDVSIQKYCTSTDRSKKEAEEIISVGDEIIKFMKSDLRIKEDKSNPFYRILSHIRRLLAKVLGPKK